MCVCVCACARVDSITLPALVMSSKLHSENQATNRLTLLNMFQTVVLISIANVTGMSLVRQSRGHA